ncbi:MAG: tetratricopeptide repeat protein [Phycisphaerae bacterium]
MIVPAVVLLGMVLGDGPSPRGDPQPGAALTALRSRAVRIELELWAGQSSLDGVELWTTSDDGASWSRARTTPRDRTTIEWTAPRDGAYGLFVVARNAVGASSSPPQPGTAPQQRLLIDATAPRIERLEVARDGDFAQTRRVTLRWAASDDHFRERPVRLSYRAGESLTFRLIDQFPAAGETTWTVPNELRGALRIRVAARDSAGNEAERVSAQVELPESQPPETPAMKPDAGEPRDRPAPAAAPAPRPLEMRDRTAIDGPSEPPGDTARALARLRTGRMHRDRGEWDQAEERFREALEAEPGNLTAQLELAGVLLRRKRYDEAERAYRAIVEQHADAADAQSGLAVALTAQKKFESALATLETLLKLRPDDGEAWLLYGDTLVLSGYREEALQAWRHVSSEGEFPAEMSQRARQRLEIYEPAGGK